MNGNDPSVRSLLELAGRRTSTIVFEGYAREDRNVEGNLLIVESPNTIYSFSKSDIAEEEPIGGSEFTESHGTEEEGAAERRVRVWVRAGAQAFRTTPFVTGQEVSAFTVGGEHVAPSSFPATSGMPAAVLEGGAVAMEHLAPPPPPGIPGMPAPAVGAGSLAMEHIAPPPASVTHGMPTPALAPGGAVAPSPAVAFAPSLATVGANWWNSCAGGDSFANNCAHFLSDAFIRAGYTQLQSYGARCYTSAKRPIRAREMWSWFNSMATKKSNIVQANTGWWAVFQLNEQVYWGGHVALLDSNAMLYYGTGWYGNWNQYLYQW